MMNLVARAREHQRFVNSDTADSDMIDELTDALEEALRCRTCKGSGNRTLLAVVWTDPGTPEFTDCDTCHGTGRDR